MNTVTFFSSLLLQLPNSYITIHHALISNFIFITFSHRHSWFDNR